MKLLLTFNEYLAAVINAELFHSFLLSFKQRHVLLTHTHTDMVDMLRMWPRHCIVILDYCVLYKYSY